MRFIHVPTEPQPQHRSFTQFIEKISDPPEVHIEPKLPRQIPKNFFRNLLEPEGQLVMHKEQKLSQVTQGLKTAR